MQPVGGPSYLARRALAGGHFAAAAGQFTRPLGLIDGDELIGAALRTQKNVKPVFVSIGHRISLETACHWVLMQHTTIDHQKRPGLQIDMEGNSTNRTNTPSPLQTNLPII
ncbi:TPA: endonuclease V [Pseudomonas putida]|nr:endonuclease V [Pseudomonas putida]